MKPYLVDKNDRPLAKGDRVFKVFGHRRIKYYGTILTAKYPEAEILWDNGEFEKLTSWDCEDLEVDDD